MSPASGPPSSSSPAHDESVVSIHEDVRVADVMAPPTNVLHTSDTLAFASDLLFEHGLTAVPILDNSERVVGMMTVRDLLARPATGATGARPLSDVLPLRPTIVGATMKLGEAAALLVDHCADALPVVEDGVLVGVVGSSDIVFASRRVPRPAQGGRTASAADLMHRHVVVAFEDEPLDRAVWKLLDAGVRHVVVVDAAAHVVGIVTDRDIRAAVGDPLKSAAASRAARSPTVVGQVMSRNPITVTPEVSAADVAEIFLDERIGAIPVVRADETLVGIISYVDVIAHFVGRTLAPR